MYYDPIETGRRIQDLRKARKLTQEQLSEKVDISTNYLSLLETGTKSGALNTMVGIAIALNTSLDYLIFGKTPSNSISVTELDSVIASLVKMREKL